MAFVSILAKGGNASVVCERCQVADTPLRRLRGLLGRSDLDDGEGILLRPAAAIHTCFMRFPIDVVFVDRSLEVVAVSESVRPWRFARAKGAHSVIELAAGKSRRVGIATGDRLSLAEPSKTSALYREQQAEGQPR